MKTIKILFNHENTYYEFMVDVHVEILFELCGYGWTSQSNYIQMCQFRLYCSCIITCAIFYCAFFVCAFM